MKKIKIVTALLILISISAFGQKYITKTGHIWFHSEAPLETIEVHNNQVNSALDAQTGDFVFKILMKSFNFPKALMQEHFNENYVESDKFPNATFIGKVINIDDISLKKEGSVQAEITGKMSIHGVTKVVSTEGTFKVHPDYIEGISEFNITLADYDISIPGVVVGKIAEEVQINVEIKLKEIKD